MGWAIRAGETREKGRKRQENAEKGGARKNTGEQSPWKEGKKAHTQNAETYARIRRDTLASVRGTVQADILKEDQAQNTCIFSTEFAMKMMGDVQQFFIDNNVRNYYSISICFYFYRLDLVEL